MDAYQQRVVDEKDELDRRLVKLRAFIDGPDTYAQLPTEDRKLLWQQWQAMLEYSDILGQRIARFAS